MNGSRRLTDYGYSIYEITLYGKAEEQRVLLETPKLVAVKEGESSVSLSWNAVENAEKYQIYRALSLKAAKKLVAETAECACTDANLTAGTYYYWVAAAPADTQKYGVSKYSADIAGIRITTAAVPLGTTAVSAVKEGENAVKLSWSAVENAASYEIYRTTGSLPKRRIATVDTTAYTDSNLGAGSYSYRVVAIPEENSGYGAGAYSEATQPVLITEKLEKPVVTGSKSGEDGVKLSWEAVENAESYRIYRAAKPDGAKAYVGTIYSNGYVDSGLANGTYYYWVTAVPAPPTIWKATTATGSRESRLKIRLWLSRRKESH